LSADGQDAHEDVKCIPDSSNRTPRDNEHYFIRVERRGRCYLLFTLGRVGGRVKGDKGSMSNIIVVMFCIIMALLTITEIWKANKVGVATLWVMIAFMFYALGELSTSYKALAIMLNSH